MNLSEQIIGLGGPISLLKQQQQHKLLIFTVSNTGYFLLIYFQLKAASDESPAIYILTNVEYINMKYDI